MATGRKPLEVMAPGGRVFVLHSGGGNAPRAPSGACFHITVYEQLPPGIAVEVYAEPITRSKTFKDRLEAIQRAIESGEWTPPDPPTERVEDLARRKEAAEAAAAKMGRNPVLAGVKAGFYMGRLAAVIAVVLMLLNGTLSSVWTWSVVVLAVAVLAGLSLIVSLKRQTPRES